MRLITKHPKESIGCIIMKPSELRRIIDLSVKSGVMEARLNFIQSGYSKWNNDLNVGFGMRIKNRYNEIMNHLNSHIKSSEYGNLRKGE